MPNNEFEVGNKVAVYVDLAGFWCDGVVVGHHRDTIRVRYTIPGFSVSRVGVFVVGRTIRASKVEA